MFNTINQRKKNINLNSRKRALSAAVTENAIKIQGVQISHQCVCVCVFSFSANSDNIQLATRHSIGQGRPVDQMWKFFYGDFFSCENVELIVN